MQQDEHDEGPKFPVSSYKPGTGTVYNCPDHGPMWIEYGGDGESYRCPEDECPHSYAPNRDYDTYPEVGRRQVESAAQTPAAEHPPALAQAFFPPAEQPVPTPAPSSTNPPSRPNGPATRRGSPRR